MSLPFWLRSSLSLYSPEQRNFPEVALTIVDEIKNRRLGLQTSYNYITLAKKLLIVTGTVIAPDLLSRIRMEVLEHCLHSSEDESKKLMDELLAFEKRDNWERYKIWRRYRASMDTKTVFQQVLAKNLFFTDDYSHDHMFLNIVQIQENAKETLKTAQKLKLEAQLTDGHSLKRVIDKPQEMMDFMLAGLLETKNEAVMLGALLLCCGRRPSSLYMYPDDFQCLRMDPRNIDEYSCHFRERLKIGTKLHDELLFTEIPLLAPFSIFKTCLMQFRAVIGIDKNWTPTETNIKRCRKDCSNIRKLLGPIYTPRTLRPIYAALAFKLFGDGTHLNVFFKNALKHADLTTSLHYSHIVLGMSTTRLKKWTPNKI